MNAEKGGTQGGVQSNLKSRAHNHILGEFKKSSLNTKSRGGHRYKGVPHRANFLKKFLLACKGARPREKEAK